jgi:hypothetical protein
MISDAPANREANAAIGSLKLREEKPYDLFVLVCWLVIQLLALALSLSRLPLWARFDQPTEKFALAIMLVSQSALAALLLPNLVRTWRAAIAVIASAFPFMQLAGLLSDTPGSRVAIASLLVAAWIGMVLLFAGLVQTKRARSMVSTVATSVAVIVATLWVTGG